MTLITWDLIQWYRKNRILYPWRKTTDPYKIWLSEILLQQTRIPIVLTFYPKILERFPDVFHLARANDSEFLSLWSGIGYYARAHNMLKCSRWIVEKHDGIFPHTMEELLSLPGIGKYTAGAIRNVCFQELTPALDGNIKRVLARIAMKQESLETVFLKIGKYADPGDFFQSLMELGEQVCLPNPRCAICPVQKHCKANQAGRQFDFPGKKTKKETRTFHWYLLLLQRKDALFYAQNSSRDFLKQSWIFPDVLSPKVLTPAELRKKFAEAWRIMVTKYDYKHKLQHAVTYRKIHVHILAAKDFVINGAKGKWLRDKDLQNYPTSSITRKSLEILNRQTETKQKTLKKS
jgi:A/G-specific adenine glycosylase